MNFCNLEWFYNVTKIVIPNIGFLLGCIDGLLFASLSELLGIRELGIG